MKEKFEILLLGPALRFLDEIDKKARDKVLYNIRLSRELNDPELLKKLRDNIWEFRTRYQGLQFRLLAFWHHRSMKSTLVVATHGFIKKTDRVPENEIKRAIVIRKKYIEDNV